MMFDQTLHRRHLQLEISHRTACGLRVSNGGTHARSETSEYDKRRLALAGAAPMSSQRSALSPVGRETLHERVYAELRRSLIYGMFDAGDMLRIQDLAATLQTSTMPVRDALGRLVSEQALEALPNRSVRVPVITRERLEDLARARCLIEGQMTALAVANLTAEDFVRLK